MPLDHPFDTPPETGTTRPVAPGVHWLRMPLPFALDHINLWLLEDGEGFTAVDTGIAMDAGKQAWKSALAGRHLKRQIVTHSTRITSASPAGWKANMARLCG